MTTDTGELRTLLGLLLPGLQISAVPAASGQRVVYFSHFVEFAAEEDTTQMALMHDRATWGSVVLKVSAGIGVTETTYLQREIEILSALNSPAFPRLHYHDVFSVHPETEDALDERLFVTIEERIEGAPLSELTSAYREPADVLRLLIALVRGATALWEHKPPLIHRDLKPANILIRTNGDICIIDLGIARIEGVAGITSTHAFWGPCTPGYCSPEQARNDKRNITYKSDFFSLGIIAHELLTGTNPFARAGISVMDILQNVLNAPAPPLHGVPNMPPRFATLISSMLQKEPYRRPRSPAALLSMLEEIGRDMHVC